MSDTLNNSRVLSGQKEIALFLGVSVKTVRRYMAAIPVRQFGKKFVVLETDLIKWVKIRPKGRPSK
ncbi:MAG TPA: hypothetical protein DDW49_03140 [Deltaproteobacteria bacterium]|nr:MAG: hypothetical protein A2048_06020 [Deltaproteobacteria bacterium GWA2_45_12]HBF12376.1 hypothetical protein [Deltaproteobacteria bacterium]